MKAINSTPPKIGIVSLGCPKALVDSERIITQLRSEGYQISDDYEGASAVIVNTCGFIDTAKKESLEAISEALTANGKVIVTGCMGVNDVDIKAIPEDVISISGPQDIDAVMNSVRSTVPVEHDPFIELIPPQGFKLTPRHYAYLKISEGCNHKCSFCIIPSMRGKLQSRHLSDVMQEAERLVEAGVKELLIISQDTSAYGIDILIKKRIKRFRTWLSYSLSKTNFDFNEIQTGAFPGNFDQRHILTLSGTYKFKQLQVSLGWNLASGKPLSLPSGIESTLNDNNEPEYTLVYEQQNNERLKTYHRMDASVIYDFKLNKVKDIKARLGFSVLNLYNQTNQLDKVFNIEESSTTDPEIVQQTLIGLGITPNVLFRVTF